MELNLALERLRLELLSKAIRRAFISTAIASLCVGLLSRGAVPTYWLLAWIVLGLGSIALRRWFAGRWLAHPPQDPRRALERMVLLSAFVGLAHGAVAFLLVPYNQPIEQLVVTMVVVCWCAGTLILGTIAPRVYYAFVIFASGPFALYWLGRGGEVGIVVGLLIILMFAMIALFTRDAVRVFEQSFHLRNENIELVHKLELAKRRRANFIEYLNHDLRNALGVVGMSFATLAARDRPPEEKEVLDRAGQGVDWARRLIDGLDEVAQIESGSISVRTEPTALDTLAATLLQTFETAALERRIALSVRAAPVTVQVDPNLLFRILQNLVDNAIKYTPAGRVAVEASYSAGQMRWTVDDSGPGVPLDKHERIFEEYFQIDNPGRAAAKGRGLGLFIVKCLVELMGGTVEVDRGTLGGARFTVTLPCALGAAALVPMSTVTASDTQAPPRSVWILEDQEAPRVALEGMLSAHGHRVRAFATAAALQEALAHAGDPPEAVLCDLWLSEETSGLAVAESIRAEHAGVRVAIITGQARSSLPDVGGAAPIAMFRKPVDARLLSDWLASNA